MSCQKRQLFILKINRKKLRILETFCKFAPEFDNDGTN